MAKLVKHVIKHTFEQHLATFKLLKMCSACSWCSVCAIAQKNKKTTKKQPWNDCKANEGEKLIEGYKIGFNNILADDFICLRC